MATNSAPGAAAARVVGDLRDLERAVAAQLRPRQRARRRSGSLTAAPPRAEGEDAGVAGLDLGARLRASARHLARAVQLDHQPAARRGDGRLARRAAAQVGHEAGLLGGRGDGRARGRLRPVGRGHDASPASPRPRAARGAGSSGGTARHAQRVLGHPREQRRRHVAALVRRAARACRARRGPRARGARRARSRRTTPRGRPSSSGRRRRPSARCRSCPRPRSRGSPPGGRCPRAPRLAGSR